MKVLNDLIVITNYEQCGAGNIISYIESDILETTAFTSIKQMM
jgi:hypothetical protein